MNQTEIAREVARRTGAKPVFVAEVVERGIDAYYGKDPVRHFENVIAQAQRLKVRYPAQVVHFFCHGGTYKP